MNSFLKGNNYWFNTIVLFICFFVSILTARAQNSTVSIAHSKLILGTYGGAPHLKNGRVDVKRLVHQLKDIHATTYGWWMPHMSSDSAYSDYENWNDFKLFLKYAQKMGLKVWVNIYPPSFSTGSKPFGFNFELWASKIATLSLSYPCLVGWSIDDFSHNQKVFTPKRLKRILHAAHMINPTIAFIPCCYYPEMTPQFVAKYKHLLDGILFPYRAGSEGRNLKNPNLVDKEMSHLRKLFGVEFPIYLDVYATAHSTLGATTPGYVKKVITAGKKVADGVIIYRNQQPDEHPKKYQIIKKEFRQ